MIQQAEVLNGTMLRPVIRKDIAVSCCLLAARLSARRPHLPLRCTRVGRQAASRSAIEKRALALDAQR